MGDVTIAEISLLMASSVALTIYRTMEDPPSNEGLPGIMLSLFNLEQTIRSICPGIPWDSFGLRISLIEDLDIPFTSTSNAPGSPYTTGLHSSYIVGSESVFIMISGPIPE